jgi:outer membrane protein assembly factor BamB
MNFKYCRPLGVFLSVVLAACGGGKSDTAAPPPTAPSITVQPADTSVAVGQTATFSVTAAGSAPLSYQWQMGTTPIAGATAASYTTPATVAGDDGSTFQVVVTNSAGMVTSVAAKLGVTLPPPPTAPSITVQPADTSVAVGQTATFSVTAAGTVPLTYQWKKGTTVIAGATAASYTTPATVAGDDASTFQVTVTNSAGTVTSRAAKLAVTAAPPPTAPSISVQPADKSVTAGQTAAFSVTAAGTAPLSYQWKKGATAIAGATAASYTTPATVAGDNGSTFQVTVTNAGGNVTSRAAKLTVTTAPSGTDVLTYKNDFSRSGQNLSESTLTLTNVASATFGLLHTLAVDGKVDAQPLYVSKLSVAGTAHNTVFVATEHDSVYAFDADTGTKLWSVSLLGAGEILSDTHGCGQVVPEIGITSTPVIDRNAGAHGTIFVVAMSKDASSNYHQRLHALDLTTGAELLGGPMEVAATYPTSGGGTTTFSAGQYEERAALLLYNGTIYTSWTSHCDGQPYTGWVIAYAESTFARTAVLNVAPNSGGAGPAIWMSGGGPAIDAAGNLYLLTGNGVFETTLDTNGFPNKQDYGNSFLKISTAGGGLNITDYFTMFNEVAESSADQDLGSGGAMLLPDLTDAGSVVRHLVVGAGKDGNIYLVNRDSMGKFNAGNNSQIWQQLSGALPGGIWSTPAYFNGTVYYGSVSANLKAFTLSNAKLVATPQSQSTTQYAYPGTAPSVSANGTSNAIVWANENTNPAVLHAYDAANLANEIYNSNQAAANRDHFGTGNKYITPTVADGKVFVGTTNGVGVFGLLP